MHQAPRPAYRSRSRRSRAATAGLAVALLTLPGLLPDFAAAAGAPVPHANLPRARGVVLEDFESGSVTLVSHDPAQDQEPNSWNVSSAEAYGGSQYSLRLYGNTWKAEPIAPYPIAAGTVLQAAALVPSIGEMQAFGVSDGTNTLYYTFEGTQLPTSDPWSVVYQGAFPEGGWNLYLLPIGQDWRDRYGYLPTITRLVFVNDRDAGNTGSIYFDSIADVTGDLPQAPSVEIVRGRQSAAKVAEALYRVSVQFGSQVSDPDTPPEALTYRWDFGDGGTSAEPSPLHEFLVAADYTYTVTLCVRDPEGLWGRDSTQVRVDPGAPQLPITMNFVGDVMLARGYDSPGGLVDQHGPEWMFLPTRPYLGEGADLNLCNLECPFTDEGVPHPTKSVVFRARPANIAGIAYAGFDAVSLGNNHIVDYGQRGMEETQEVLDGVGIPWCGADDDEYLALQPIFLNRQGISVGLFGQCNRTGREYNYQPFLDAGYNKPGFAWEIAPNLDRAIAATAPLADLVVAQLHSGIEYATGPGALAGSGWPLEGTAPPERSPGSPPARYAAAPHPIDPEDSRFHPAGEPPCEAPGLGLLRIDEFSHPGDEPGTAGATGRRFPPGSEDEPVPADDFLFPTRPSLTDRQLRWHAVDAGADLLICHHPHVLQGFEVYQGALIAHSLGNFVFDMGAAETFPTLILYAEFDKEGFRRFTFRPAFVDDWVPRMASGRLGREILDRQAEYSRELNTIVTVDPAQMLGTIHLHQELVWTPEVFERTEPLVASGGWWVTPPVQRDGEGALYRILPASGGGAVEVRLGREMLWHGDFEDEGATFWDLNSAYEGYDASVAHQGQRSLRLRRSDGTSGVVTTLQGYPALLGGRDFSISVWIRTQNANDASFTANFYTGRGSGQVGAFEVTDPIDGTSDWTRYWRDFIVAQTPWFLNVRASIAAPASGEETAWFDEARVVAWDSWQPLTQAMEVPCPSNYRFLQFRTNQAAGGLSISWEDAHGEEAVSGLHGDPGAPAGPAAGPALRLGAPRPSPFRAAVGIEYRLAQPGRVRVEVFDVAGRRVATLLDAERPAGAHREIWSAGDAPDGLYFVRCEAGGETRTQKVVRIR